MGSRQEEPKRELTPAEREQRRQARLKHGVRSYEETGHLAAALRDFDVALAAELLDLVGGDPAFQLLATSAARRATILELAYSWLARADVEVFWVEDQNGRKVLCWQPLLDKLGTYHEGLRRDLQELGLTPVARARLDLGLKQLSLDDLLEVSVGGARDGDAGE